MSKAIPIPLSKEFAGRVYDILEDVCGAHKDFRDDFVREYTSSHPSTEWRFQGKLGFGGKLYLRYDRITVSCYQEDMTDERAWMIAKANEDLEELVTDLIGSPTS